jgi:hypothetical protein
MLGTKMSSLWHNDSTPGEWHSTLVPPPYWDSLKTTNDSNLESPYYLNGDTRFSITGFLGYKFDDLVTVSRTSNVG